MTVLQFPQDADPLSGTSSHTSQQAPFLDRSESGQLYGPKEKRQASITPRKFRRFFTPRSQDSHSASTRRVLFDITTPVNNRHGVHSSPLLPFPNKSTEESSPLLFPRELKRRKTVHSPNSSPESTFSDKWIQTSPSFTSAAQSSDIDEKSSKGRLSYDFQEDLKPLPKDHCGRQIRQLETRGLTGQLLQLSLGSKSTLSASKYITDWHDETAAFYSRAEDTHFCTSTENPDRCIPFCAVSCNTNSLVAVGDEEGRVRLLESTRAGHPSFKETYLSFRPHSNAVIDMCFTQDDSLLATASGDQTARIIDMTTQTTISVLAQHSASLKQVRFQPGASNKSVIATSSRDGTIQIWDLRCKGIDGPMQKIHIPVDATDNSVPISRSRTIVYGCAVNTIANAHRPHINGLRPHNILSGDGPSRGEAPGRIGDVSVTSISFLPEGREHIILSASEANASVKLWDIRSLHSARGKSPCPLSCTAEPSSHSKWRHFGICSMNLGGDGSRLYTLCKDNTVYAYSVTHLVLGQSSDLSANAPRRRPQYGETHMGLGPLYGFRHPQLHVTSFYVKSALRVAKNGKSEMLAVGSSDGCTILFPTDERYHMSNDSGCIEDVNDDKLPEIRRRSSGISALSRLEDGIQISENGTPLIRGHDKEVGSLTWNSEGDLVTVGDDFIVRCWREGPDARKLRMGGEEGGRRWGSGWADVPEVYDDDDDEDANGFDPGL